MDSLQRAARAGIRAQARLLYPETVTWTEQDGAQVTCRCALTDLSVLPSRDLQALMTQPQFQSAQAKLSVHPDDPRPGTGAVAEHARFGHVQVTGWGSESYYTGQRLGAVTWIT